MPVMVAFGSLVTTPLGSVATYRNVLVPVWRVPGIGSVQRKRGRDGR